VSQNRDRDRKFSETDQMYVHAPRNASQTSCESIARRGRRLSVVVRQWAVQISVGSSAPGGSGSKGLVALWALWSVYRGFRWLEGGLNTMLYSAKVLQC
jgi:hypothetical protein